MNVNINILLSWNDTKANNIKIKLEDDLTNLNYAQLYKSYFETYLNWILTECLACVETLLELVELRTCIL